MSDKKAEKKAEKKAKENTVVLERLQRLIDGEKSRQVIADKIDCDVSLITKHYNGDRIVTIDFLKKYAEYFGVSADYLLGLTNAATTEKDLQAVCDYTGLNETNIDKLHSFTYPEQFKIEKERAERFCKLNNIEFSEDYLKSIKESAKYSSENALTPINDILFSNEISELVNCYYNAIILQNEFFKVLAFLFDDREVIGEEVKEWDISKALDIIEQIDPEKSMLPLFDDYHLLLWNASKIGSDYISRKVTLLDELDTSKDIDINIYDLFMVVDKELSSFYEEEKEEYQSIDFESLCKCFNKKDLLKIKDIYEREKKTIFNSYTYEL